ncbi:MAG: metallophosphoesterase [Candidatus Gastranaerophilaceae bacterium]
MKFLFRLNFIFLLFAVFFTQSVFAKDIKFIQVTDSHYSSIGEEYTQKEVENSQSVLEKTIKDINSVPNVDFVVFTGDNIDTANCADLKSFLTLANKLNIPYYIVIGNHEVFKSQKLDKQEYMAIVRKYSKSCKPGSANYVFRKNGLVFLVVDGAKEVIPGPAGYYKKDTLKWLDKQLTKYKREKVVIFQHFPIVAPYYNRTHTTYNVKDYEAILKKHSNVIAIFSGHYHANGEVKRDGIYHVSTPALVEPPHNYKIIEISLKNKNDCQIYTRLRHAE